MDNLIFSTIDVGSTETRVLRFNVTGNNVTSPLATVVDSAYGIIDREIGYVESKSGDLMDNLEIVLEDKSRDKLESEKMFTKLQIAKGSLLRTLRLSPCRMDSQTRKSLQQSFYVTVISGLGISLVKTYADKLELGGDYSVDLTIALPPEDTKSTTRLEQIKKKLSGVYGFELPRLGVSFTLRITPDRIFIDDESQANLRYYCVKEKSDVNQKGRVILFDVGGRSTDQGMIEDGTLIKGMSHTYTYGGMEIQSYLAELIEDKYDYLTLSPEMAKDAAETGFVQDGDTMIDIKDLINQARKKFAIKLFTDFSQVLSNNAIKSTAINKILFVGRPNKQMEGTIAICNIFKRLFEKQSPNTEVSRITIDNPIIYGLMFYRASKL